MAAPPDDELEASRAAFASTLEAAAAILPWVGKPRLARFDYKINQRWIDAVRQLASAWSDRHHTMAPIRPAIFGLYCIAIETADSDCLRLGEALASAADQLEQDQPAPRLVAALSGTIECLNDARGLENDAFAERAQHFAQRLEAVAQTTEGTERSPLLDRLFVGEALEQIELMRDALAALPPDVYALTTESIKLAQQAEVAELWGVMHLARQLAECINQNLGDLDSTTTRQTLENLLQSLTTTITAVDG